MAYIDAKKITKTDINELFLKIIDDIYFIMYSDFYKEKESLLKVEKIKEVVVETSIPYNYKKSRF